MKIHGVTGIMRGLMVAVVLAAFAVNALAGPGDPPNLISFQSYLVDIDGNPLGADGHGASDPTNYDVQFSIYDSPSGGELLWREEQTITVDSGYFSVHLA